MGGQQVFSPVLELGSGPRGAGLPLATLVAVGYPGQTHEPETVRCTVPETGTPADSQPSFPALAAVVDLKHAVALLDKNTRIITGELLMLPITIATEQNLVIALLYNITFSTIHHGNTLVKKRYSFVITKLTYVIYSRSEGLGILIER